MSETEPLEAQARGRNVQDAMSKITLKTYEHASIWIGALIVGILAVTFARLITTAQNLYSAKFESHPLLVTLATPFLFFLATALVRKLAPEAKGSGIPQVLIAIDQTDKQPFNEENWRSDLVSLKTAGVKIISSVLGILGGASIGREGPTVQIASSCFAAVARFVRKKIPSLKLETFLVAGASAGVAAAFNTPLAGITFAVEEIAEEAFGTFRRSVMLGVIISGITAQALVGDYLYFGHPSITASRYELLPQAAMIGLMAGILGGAFAKLLAFPKLTRLPEKWWIRASLCGVICAGVAYFTDGATSGSGYEITKTVLSLDNLDNASVLFPLWKTLTTVTSYLSGMAGGIFSPCLSIGAGVGISIAKLAHFLNFKACALIGMVAFFSGAVQAPLTAVIIVVEMTGQHILVLPFMLAALIGHGIGKLFMPIPLYKYLAHQKTDR